MSSYQPPGKPPGLEQAPSTTAAATPVAASVEKVPLAQMSPVDVPPGFREPPFQMEVSFPPGTQLWKFVLSKTGLKTCVDLRLNHLCALRTVLHSPGNPPRSVFVCEECVC